MKIKISVYLMCLALIFSSTNLWSQIPNQGFESWTTDLDGNLNPTTWETTNSSPDVSVSQYTPAYAGSYSMKVAVFDPGFMGVPGYAMLSFPYSSKPATISACIKTNIMPGDAVYVIVSLFNGDSIVASPGNCSFMIDSTINQFTCFTFPITYQSPLVPDSANIMVIAGKSGVTLVGTHIIIDDLTFGLSTDIEESIMPSSATLGRSFPNPASSSASLPLNLQKASEITLRIFDVLGKEVKAVSFGFLEKGDHLLDISLEDLPAGIYQYAVNGDGFSLADKITVN